MLGRRTDLGEAEEACGLGSGRRFIWNVTREAFDPHSNHAVWLQLRPTHPVRARAARCRRAL